MATQYKLLALDLDGTLIKDDLIISPAAKDAIWAARKQGVVVTLATGRMFKSAKQFADELELDVPIICYQGAMVRHSRTGETLLHQPVPLDLARQFITFTNSKGYYAHGYVDDHIYVPSRTPEALEYARLARVEAEPVGDLLEFFDRPEHAPTKLVIVTSEDKTLSIVDELQTMFQDKLYVTMSHPRFAEAIHPACSKGAALAALAASLDIPREQVIAIGDNHNDLPMIEWAGLGVAVGSAAAFVREKADYVTKAGVGQAVVETIERFILS